MKPKTLLVGGLALFLGFTFLPIGINNGDVIDGYYATTSYASAVSRSQSAMVAPYITSGEVDEENSPAIKQVVESMGSGDGLADSIFLLTPVGDPYNFSAGIWSDIRQTCNLTKLRPGTWSGWHGGVDLGTKTAAGSTYVVWNCALFSGTVVDAQNESSRGRQVTIESDDCPGLFIRYCHMAPGRGGNYDSYIQNNTASTTSAGGSTLVKVGDHVAKGDPVGVMGNTGSSGGTHLHFDIFVDIDLSTHELKTWASGVSKTTNWRTSITDLYANGKSFKGLKWYLYPGANKPGTPLTLDDIELLIKMGDVFDDEPSDEEGAHNN